MNVAETDCRICGVSLNKIHSGTCPHSGFVKKKHTTSPPRFPWTMVRIGAVIFSLSCQSLNLVFDLRTAVSTRDIILDIARNSCIGGIIAGGLIVAISIAVWSEES